MNRALLPVAGTVVGLVALLSYRTPGTAPATAATDPPASVPSGGRTVTGDVAATRWGPVQVALVLDTSGRITAVQVLQQPSGNGRDREINSYALPQLVSETLSAQSARIDTVSGATVTSEGYLTSLQSALDHE